MILFSLMGYMPKNIGQPLCGEMLGVGREQEAQNRAMRLLPYVLYSYEGARACPLGIEGNGQLPEGRTNDGGPSHRTRAHDHGCLQHL
jgi:hypothetical protein